MKVTGPGDPPLPQPPESAEPTAPAGAADVDEPGAAAGADRPGAATEAANADGPVAIGDLAADLQAGRLTRDGAIEKLVDRVIAQHAGPDAPPAVREKVRAALADALDGDPLLAEKLKALG